MEVRKLKTKDLFTFIKIVKPVMNIADIQALWQKQPKQSDYGLENADEYNDARRAFTRDVANYVIESIADILVDNELRKWLASLGNMSLTEFDESELDTTFVIISQTIEQNDMLDFFSKVSNMMKNSIGNRLTTSNNVTVG